MKLVGARQCAEKLTALKVTHAYNADSLIVVFMLRARAAADMVAMTRQLVNVCLAQTTRLGITQSLSQVQQRLQYCIF